MAHVIQGETDSASRILVIDESDYNTVEANATVSGAYEVEVPASGTKTVIARTDSGEAYGYSGVSTIEVVSDLFREDFSTWDTSKWPTRTNLTSQGVTDGYFTYRSSSTYGSMHTGNISGDVGLTGASFVLKVRFRMNSDGSYNSSNFGLHYDGCGVFLYRDAQYDRYVYSNNGGYAWWNGTNRGLMPGNRGWMVYTLTSNNNTLTLKTENEDPSFQQYDYEDSRSIPAQTGTTGAILLGTSIAGSSVDIDYVTLNAVS